MFQFDMLLESIPEIIKLGQGEAGKQTNPEQRVNWSNMYKLQAFAKKHHMLGG